ncbi:hypothetical protein KL942_001475 [Ogataea angusta]|uniref:Coronin n=1 Tax=Pichia angusta TaxID=870730 RepID=A0ABQ7S0F0_PICAN|nr:hypothetical protein KL942_001475 [Ogataea angusta]KAG7850827.1 hypothetical protein KL940_001404 [Ogataea angusta]
MCYENLKVTISAFDSNIVKCNGRYLSVNANSIGAFLVIPVDEVGKAPDKVPMFRGHTGGLVLDTDFDPFHENRLASAGEDGKILLWEIPPDYTFAHVDPDNIQDVAPVASLAGHSRKVGHVVYHPVAENVLASSSFDYSVKLWNLATRQCERTLQHKDLVTSFCFNYDGSKIVTASRDKKIRVWDVHTGKVLSEGPGHTGAKAPRVCWLGKHDRFVTTGFDRFSERQLGVWKADNVEDGPVGGFYSVDASSGVLMPFFDDSTNILFVAGKGDGNVRYYEFDKDELYLISEFPSTSPQRGYAVGPKRYVNVRENEIVRAYKLHNDNMVEPISFIVPRRSEMFQDDIYPDAPAGVPALTAEEFFAGKTSGPVLVSMRDLYEGVGEPATCVGEMQEKEPEKEQKKEPEKVEPVRPLPAAQPATEPDLKNKEEVTTLLNKVNEMSDDDTQEVDADDEEWQEVTKREVREKESTGGEEEAGEPKEAEVEEKAQEAVKEEAKEPQETVREAAKSSDVVSDKETAAPVPEPASSTPVASSTVRAAGGLKSSMDKLHALVTQLESAVDQLQAASTAKDERLAALEAKIDQLLAKSA